MSSESLADEIAGMCKLPKPCGCVFDRAAEQLRINNILMNQACEKMDELRSERDELKAQLLHMDGLLAERGSHE